MTYCPDCRSTHMGSVPCGLSYAARLRSTQVNRAGFDTASKVNYYDADAVHRAFGEDAREAMLEETRGLGPIRRARDGSEWVYDNPATGEMRPLETSDIVGGYLRGTPVDPDE